MKWKIKRKTKTFVWISKTLIVANIIAFSLITVRLRILLENSIGKSQTNILIFILFFSSFFCISLLTTLSDTLHLFFSSSLLLLLLCYRSFSMILCFSTCIKLYILTYTQAQVQSSCWKCEMNIRAKDSEVNNRESQVYQSTLMQLHYPDFHSHKHWFSVFNSVLFFFSLLLLSSTLFAYLMKTKAFIWFFVWMKWCDMI